MLLIFKCFESVRTEPLSRRVVYIIILDIRISQSYALLYTTTGTLSVIIQIQRVRSIARWYPYLLVVSNTLEGPRTHSVTFTKLAYSTAITPRRRWSSTTSFYSWCWPFSVWGPLTAVCVISPTPRTISAQLISVSKQSFSCFFFQKI